MTRNLLFVLALFLGTATAQTPEQECIKNMKAPTPKEYKSCLEWDRDIKDHLNAFGLRWTEAQCRKMIGSWMDAPGNRDDKGQRYKTCVELQEVFIQLSIKGDEATIWVQLL